MTNSPLPLKDIHVPAEIGWWPLAIGWWLALGVIVILCILAYLFWRRLRRRTVLTRARKLLVQLQQNNTLGTQQKLSELSILLRRVAISITPRQHAASLTGQAWLDYLDSTLPDKPFSNGIGQCLVDAQYRPQLDSKPDISALIKLCERWLKAQKIKL